MQFCPICSDGTSGRLATRGDCCDVCWKERCRQGPVPINRANFHPRPEHFPPSMRENLMTDSDGNVRMTPNGRAVTKAPPGQPMGRIVPPDDSPGVAY